MTNQSKPLADPSWIIGIDGGGTGTRAQLRSADTRVRGHGTAGPSGLGQGVAQAWCHVEQAIAQSFASVGLPTPARATCALGLGLAGAGRADLHQAFLDADPGYARVVLDTDAGTLLLGAHGDRPGLVIAAGTGSVGARHGVDGTVRLAGGWGFPVGDEGSGAWLGLQAVRHAQAVLDGRAAGGALARTILQRTGATTTELLAWCGRSGQHAYAALAPGVFEAAADGDRVAAALLQSAADELALLVQALQPAGTPLPVVLAGSVGVRLQSRWPAELRARCVAPLGDATDGALRLIHAALADPMHDARLPASR